ncbi:MAG: hypothetical protein BWY21_00957 [Parcubacteria group bacterium ADurb.Bin216]|nr:MAG: hypothetical protein BWY21_00957 [Parcubacteria group bacterium ADurb.Bin216]
MIDVTIDAFESEEMNSLLFDSMYRDDEETEELMLGEER